MAITTTPFKTGFDVKPLTVLANGQVIFTDGTNGLLPNQPQCEAYGYTYNADTNTCSAFKFTPNLVKNFNNENNKIKGTGNVAESGTNNTYILGEQNTIKGLSRNNIVAGNNNQIQNSVNNSFVYGTLGNATVDNSIVLGGNAIGDLLGERQVTTLLSGRQTTDNSTVNSYLNNDGKTLYAISNNTAMYFQADILAIDATEGGSYTGSFKSWVERGVVINESGTLSISRTRTSPASSGTTTGWSPISTVSGTDYVLTVKGATGQTVEWVASIRFTQIKTNVAL